jgi:uncharacterized repeat protein (TIGR01451 family)
VSVIVTAAPANTYNNTSGLISSTESGAGLSASASLTVGAILPPSITKAFAPTSIQAGTPSTISFIISNPNNATTLSGISFTDTYPSGLVNTAPLVTTNTCGGLLTASGNGTSISLSGVSIGPKSSCTVSIQVTANTSGSYTNSSGVVTSTNGGSGNTSSAILSVATILPPSIHKVFLPVSIEVGQTSTLTLTITNPNGSSELNGIAFTDTFPSGMTVANTPTTPQCGGTVSSISGSISLSGGVIASGTQCTVFVNVTSTVPKTSYVNNSGIVSSINGGVGNSDSANLTVTTIKAPVFTSMSYSPNQVVSGANTTLSFTINNPNTSTTLTGIAFSDTYPIGTTNVNPLVTTNTCGGTLSASGGGNTIALSGVTLAVGPACTVSIQVTTSTIGNYTNSTGSISSTNGGTGLSASANLLVISGPCNSSTVTHLAITYPSATTMQMTITNGTGNQLNLNQVKVWWNYAYGNYKNGPHPREPLSLEQVQLESVILIGPSNYPTSPLTIPGSGHVLMPGTSDLTVTFVDTYNNHEYDAFTMTFTNPECSGFTVSAP